jgi:hypothetical protein
MNSNDSIRQGHRLLQLGVAVLALTSIQGLIIPTLPEPRLGLSVHTLGVLQALLFMAFGFMWPRLNLGRGASRVAWWTYVYSSFATWAAYIMAATWGAGGTTMPLATNGAVGTAAQETAIRIVLTSSAPTFLIAIVLIMRGLQITVATLAIHREPITESTR